MAARPDVDNDLREANNIAFVYEALIRLHRLTGAIKTTNAIKAKRITLWQHSSRSLPNNAFVAEHRTDDGICPPRARADLRA